MKRIGLISDTHSHVHPRIFEFFKDCDEIWHAGDIGDLKTADEIAAFKKFRAVYGNIDGNDVISVYPKELLFEVEKVKIFITHVGGYPGNYPKYIRQILERDRPNLFICGHSHILKIIYDDEYSCLHMNPGAAGKFGFHQSITLLRFVIQKNKLEDLEILDIPRGTGILKL